MSQVSTESGDARLLAARCHVRKREAKPQTAGREIPERLPRLRCGVCGQIVKDLRLTTGPANGGAQGAFRFSQPEEKFLAVLRQKPEPPGDISSDEGQPLPT